jgi:hypothetical protein
MQTELRAGLLVRHLAPYRGARGGAHTNYANVPPAPMHGGTLAHAVESADWRMCRNFGAPLGWSAPLDAKRRTPRRTEKAGVRYGRNSKAGEFFGR